MVERKPLPGERVLIYDCEGYFMGASLAERLARQGRTVTLVTAFPGAGPAMDFTGESLFFTPELRRLGVHIVLAHRIREIRPEGVIGCALATPERDVQWPVEATVLVTSRVAADGLYREVHSDAERLAGNGIEAVYRIGDCLAPRLHVAEAIFDGHRLAREIDSPHPAEPLPYLRERALA
jgi:dimethylamine/trimethylamine dehydrogenase